MNNANVLNFAQLFLNRTLAAEHRIVVSCDAHSESTYLFTVDTRTGEIVVDRNIVGGAREVVKAIVKIAPAEEMVVLYEAGCLGFSLYRMLAEKGIKCKVIAPNSIPEQRGNKTDRNDAIGNLNYYCSGLLRFVWVPKPEIESARECLRYRFNLVWERTAEKQKVQAMLKRHGLIFTGTKKSWTKKHHAWLKEIELPEEVRIVLDMQLSRIDDHDKNIDKIDTQLMKLINTNQDYSRLYNFYNAITGIGPLGAMTWVFEGNDLNRFRHPCNLMSYLGLVPRKNSSANKNPALSITKAGNAYLRYVTVVAARCYSDRRLVQKDVQIKQYPQQLADLVIKCQDRLCNRYQHLRRNKKNGNKSKVAVARELCAFIWELAVKVIPQIENYSCAQAA